MKREKVFFEQGLSLFPPILTQRSSQMLSLFLLLDSSKRPACKVDYAPLSALLARGMQWREE